MLITFDLDGVLHINPFRKGVFPDLCRRMAPLVMEREGLTESDARRHVLRRIVGRSRRRLVEGDALGALDWDSVANEVARETGYRERIDVTTLVEQYCLPDIIGLYPGAGEILSWLRQRDAVVGTLSNGFESYQYPVLEKTGIARHFHFRVSPEMVGAAKPDRRIFEAAVRRAEGIVPAGRLRPRLHVGDALLYDVLGARRSDFLAVWIVGGVDGHGMDPGEPLNPSKSMRERREAWKPLAALSPWERPRSPHFEAFRRLCFTGLEVELFEAKRTEATPQFVIGRLDELRTVVERLFAQQEG